jgi:hypothetical protein
VLLGGLVGVYARRIRYNTPVMRRSIAAAIVAIAICAPLAVPLGAQWLHYPTAGVPMTPSGFPNLGAPAPRTADGKPDLSGIWEAENVLPCDPNTSSCTDLRAGPEIRDIAARLPSGLPYKPWAADLSKARAAENGRDWPHSRCLPLATEIHTTPMFKKFVQAPGLLVILHEFNASYRQIFTDGRPLPVDPNPSWNGYSSGRWEGDTLVVESSGFRDGLWLDIKGDPLTDAAKVTERFRRLNYGNMEIELTIDDPKAYSKPWTIKLHEFIVLNTELLDYICMENEKDMSHMVGK